MQICVLFAMHFGEVLCLGAHVFDSRIQLLDKNSRL